MSLNLYELCLKKIFLKLFLPTTEKKYDFISFDNSYDVNCNYFVTFYRKYF